MCDRAPRKHRTSENSYYANFVELRQFELRRIPILRTRLNKGMKKGIGASDSSPDSPTHLGYYGHFFKPPGEVSLFCPGAHLPVGVVSGLPLPGPSSIAAKAATLPNDIVSANISAAINNEIRFLIASHLLSFCPKTKTGLKGSRCDP